MFHPYLNAKNPATNVELQLASARNKKKSTEENLPRNFSACASYHDLHSLSGQWHLTGKLTHKKLESIAKKFTLRIRQKIATKVQETMLLSGKDWNTHTGIKCVKSISSTNLRNLYKKIGKLTHSEIRFLKRFFDTSLILTHTTNQNILDESGHARLFSRQKLIKKGIAFPLGNTQNADLDQLATDDHVFFSIEESGQNGKVQSRFGRYKFSFPLERVSSSKNALMHLFDPITKTFPYPPKWLKGFESLNEDDQNSVMKHLNEHVNGFNTINSFFHGDHILPGLAFSIIERCRYLPAKMNEDILEKSDLNSLINGLYRPQILFPKQFIAKPMEISDNNVNTDLLVETMLQNLTNNVGQNNYSDIYAHVPEENTVLNNHNSEKFSKLHNPISSINDIYGTYFDSIALIGYLNHSLPFQQNALENNAYQPAPSVKNNLVNTGKNHTSSDSFEDILCKMSLVEFEHFLDDTLKNISNDEVIKLTESLHTSDNALTGHFNHDRDVSATSIDNKQQSTESNHPYFSLPDTIDVIANMSPEAFEAMLNSSLSAIDNDLLHMIKLYNDSNVVSTYSSLTTSGEIMPVDASVYPEQLPFSIENHNVFQPAYNNTDNFKAHLSGTLPFESYQNGRVKYEPTPFQSKTDDISLEFLTLEELINLPVDQILKYITPKINHSLPLQSEPFFACFSPQSSLPTELQNADFWLNIENE